MTLSNTEEKNQNLAKDSHRNLNLSPSLRKIHVNKPQLQNLQRQILQLNGHQKNKPRLDKVKIDMSRFLKLKNVAKTNGKNILTRIA